jgi:hypothetical protein
MEEVEVLSGLGAKDQRVLILLCERALAVGDLLAPMSLQDVASAETVADLGGEASQSLASLLEQGYIYRSGPRRYTLTATGFQRYARAHVADYERREEAIKDALAGVEQTTTEAIMVRTAESRHLVNHVLRLLQRDRQIGGFVNASGNYCVTHISRGLRHRQESQRAAE